MTANLKVNYVLRQRPTGNHTVILRGGYTEITPVYDHSGIYTGARRKSYGPGSVLMRRAAHQHRLELPAGETAWTLVITGPKVQEWGFIQPDKYKIHHVQYRAARGTHN
jgi:hypothetical protein